MASFSTACVTVDEVKTPGLYGLEVSVPLSLVIVADTWLRMLPKGKAACTSEIQKELEDRVAGMIVENTWKNMEDDVNRDEAEVEVEVEVEAEH
jgi:hypothetical protein